MTDQKRLEKALRLSEEKFAKAFHSSPVEMVITRVQDGRFLDVNEAFERNNGFSRDETIGHTSIEIGLWDDPDNRAAVMEHVWNHSRVRDWELKTRTKSGDLRIKRYSAEQIQIGAEQCLLEVCEDITSRKQIEDALKLSEEKFSKAFRSSPGIISITTLRDGLFLDVNESFERQTGYSREALLGHTSLEIGLWIDPAERESLARDIEKQGFARDQEVHFRPKSGQVAVIQLSAEMMELHGEKCLLKVGQDITSRKLAEEELRKAQARIESVLNSMTDAHILFDLDWRYLYVNEAAIGAIGLPREQIPGQTLWNLNPDIVGTEIDRQYRRAMDGRCPVQFDFHHPAHDTWWEYRFYPAPEGLAVFATEITERKRAEERLREYEKVVEGLEEMIVIVDRKYRLRLVNRAYASYRGKQREQLVGHLLWDVLDSEVSDNLVKEKLDECLEGNVVHFETRYKYSDLGERDLRVSYFPIEDDHGVDRAVGVIQDITQQKRAEAEGQRLSGHLLRLQDEERRRIARELHDSTGQDLVALTTTLSQLHTSMPSPGRKPRILTSRCKALADQCIREIRTLSYLLYPPMLDGSVFSWPTTTPYYGEAHEKFSRVITAGGLSERPEMAGKPSQRPSD